MPFDPRPHAVQRCPEALRALAHPLRLELLERLGVHGPMTASQLGEALGQSPANCSWHLRKLAEHGYVTAAPGGEGRSRPWQVVTQGDASATPSGPAGDRVQQLLAQVLIDREVARFAANRARVGSGPWDDLQAATAAVLWLDVDEARRLSAELVAVLSSYQRDFADARPRPADARPVRVLTLLSVDPSRG